MKGISTNFHCTKRATCIREAGFDFVMRYYSETTRQPEKVLRRDEAQAICAAGLKLGVVYQDKNDSPKDLTVLAGNRDGLKAHEYAHDLGQPRGSAIYFAIDFDPKLPVIRTAVKDYFLGVKKGLDSAGVGSANYDVGVYGSGLVCGWIRSNLTFVKYSWLALPPKWWHREEYQDWNLKQHKEIEPLCGLPGLEWESNEVQGDFGQFSLDLK